MPPRTENQTENINSLVSEINASVGRINEGGNRNLPQLTPISPEDIAEPETDMKLPESEPEQSGVTGDLAGFELMPDQFTEQLNEQAETAETAKETSFDAYLDSLLNQESEASLTDELYSEPGGADDLKKELNKYTGLLRSEQTGLRREIERIKENTDGKSARGIANAVRRAENESYQRQADIAILANAVNDQYDTATAIVDRAVQRQLDYQKQVLDARKAIYEDNKELFDTAEQRQFETKLADRQTRIEQEAEQKKDIYNIATTYLAEGGDAATAKEIMNASTRGEALQKTGNVIGMNARLQRQKLVAEIKKLTAPPANTDVLQGKDKFDAQIKLAEVFDSRTGDYKKAATQIQNIRSSYQKAVQDASEGKSIAAASQGVIVAFNKLLDPTSVVRESEYARSAEGLSLVSQIEGQYARLKQGGAGITASDLKEFSETAETFLRGYENTAIDEAQLIIDQSVPAGLNVQQIIPGSVIDLMEDRFVEAINNTPINGTFQVGGRTYKKIGEDNFEEI